MPGPASIDLDAQRVAWRSGSAPRRRPRSGARCGRARTPRSRSASARAGRSRGSRRRPGPAGAPSRRPRRGAGRTRATSSAIGTAHRARHHDAHVVAAALEVADQQRGDHERVAPRRRRGSALRSQPLRSPSECITSSAPGGELVVERPRALRRRGRGCPASTRASASRRPRRSSPRCCRSRRTAARPCAGRSGRSRRRRRGSARSAPCMRVEQRRRRPARSRAPARRRWRRVGRVVAVPEAVDEQDRGERAVGDRAPRRRRWPSSPAIASASPSTAGGRRPRRAARARPRPPARVCRSIAPTGGRSRRARCRARRRWSTRRRGPARGSTMPGPRSHAIASIVGWAGSARLDAQDDLAAAARGGRGSWRAR